MAALANLAAVSLKHQTLAGDFHGGDRVGGGFGFDAGDGEEVMDGVGEAAVSVLPVFLVGGDATKIQLTPFRKNVTMRGLTPMTDPIDWLRLSGGRFTKVGIPQRRMEKTLG